MRLKLSDLAEADRLAVRLNGTELGDAAPLGEGRVALEPEPGLVAEGYNMVDAKLLSAPAASATPTIERLDLTVRYR